MHIRAVESYILMEIFNTIGTLSCRAQMINYVRNFSCTQRLLVVRLNLRNYATKRLSMDGFNIRDYATKRLLVVGLNIRDYATKRLSIDGLNIRD